MGMGTVWALLFGAVGGIIGWRVHGRRKRWRSLFDEAPADMTREQFERRRARRATIRQVLLTALWVIVAAAAGYAISSIRH